MKTPLEEAKMLCNALFSELGTASITPGPCPGVDGREAIEEMYEKGLPSWTENEWAGFYLKHLMQELAVQKYPDEFEELTIKEKKIYLVKGQYLWDTRLKANIATTGKTPLFGKEQMDALLDEFGGMGLLIALAQSNLDYSGDFRRWHDEFKFLKKGIDKTEYVKQVEAEGRRSYARKTDFMVIQLNAYYFTKQDILNGIKEGWIEDTFQATMRQSDGGTRVGKYAIYLDRVPKKNLLFIRNFNTDREEFAEEFDDPDWWINSEL